MSMSVLDMSCTACCWPKHSCCGGGCVPHMPAGGLSKAYPDHSILADAGAQTHDGIVHSALLQEGAMTDDGIRDAGVDNLGRWQEARGCVDGRLGVIELELGWLHSTRHLHTLYQTTVLHMTFCVLLKHAAQ